MKEVTFLMDDADYQTLETQAAYHDRDANGQAKNYVRHALGLYKDSTTTVTSTPPKSSALKKPAVPVVKPAQTLGNGMARVEG